MQTVNTAHRKYIKAIAVLLFLSSVVLFQGCSHFRTRRATSFASHQVTVDRHGVTNRFGVEERDQLAIFRYEGFGFAGEGLKVKIENDKVIVNDKNVGMLKQGDAVHIGDDGLTVNSLDYGQTAKYFEASLKQETSQNIAK